MSVERKPEVRGRRIPAPRPRTIKTGGTALAAVFALAACGGSGDTGSPDADVVKFGAIFDLTGPTADVGTDYADGIRGYVEWRNAGGGIEGRPIELAYQDYGYQVGRAEQLYSQYVGDGAVVFMGWGTGDTEALRLRIADDEVPFSSASLSHQLGDPEEAPYNFLVATSYTDQFKIALDWIVEDFAAAGGEGLPHVALMHNASPFGLSPFQQGGDEYANRLGVDVTLYEMPRGATDFTPELSRVRQAGARYVVIQNTSAPAAVLLRNAESLGFEPTFVCLNWCSNGLLLSLAGETAEGVIGAMPYAPLGVDAEGTRVIRDFLESRGESVDGKTNAFTQGWWTMAVFAEAVARVLRQEQPLTGRNIKAALESFVEFDMGGVTVPITFSATDHLGAKGLRLSQVTGGAWTPITDFLRAAP